MRSHARARLIFVIGTLLFIGQGLLVSGQDKDCDCSDPPGGRVICEVNQLAFCRVTKGRVFASCATPPKNQSSLDRKAWVLSQLKGKPVNILDLVLKENQEILEKHRFTEGDTVASFGAESWLVNPATGLPYPWIGGIFEGLIAGIPITLTLDGDPSRLKGKLDTAQGSAAVRGSFLGGDVFLRFEDGRSLLIGKFEKNTIGGIWEMAGQSARVELHKKTNK